MDIILLLEIFAAGVACLAASGGFVWSVCRFGMFLYRCWRNDADLKKELGDRPIPKLVSFYRDVTAAHGEIAIRQRIAERHIEVGICVFDQDGKCTWANDWLCEAFGLDSANMRGWGWLAAIARDDQRRVHDAWALAVEQGVPYEEEYTVEPGNRSVPWIALTQTWPVATDEGVIICYVGEIVASGETIVAEEQEES